MPQKQTMQNANQFCSGDLVEVQTTTEIADTLDRDGTLDRLPFMLEMRQFCGRRFKVQQRFEDVCPEEPGFHQIAGVVILDGVFCDGSAHEGCQRTCPILWKTAWLKPPSGQSHDYATPAAELESLPSRTPMLQAGHQCQSAELSRAAADRPAWKSFLDRHLLPEQRISLGYLHRSYAESFSGFGLSRALPRSRGWVLLRNVPHPDAADAMGLYPFCCCADWGRLREDVEELGKEVVSLTLVTDPFGGCDEAALREVFDVVKPFKEHFVTDLDKPLESFISTHHRRHARNALKVMTVEGCREPRTYLEDWIHLYDCLSARHGITGIRRFSREAFVRQFEVPGLVVFRAEVNGATVGMDLWYVQDQVAYNHLVAVSSLGYELHASYALQLRALDYFAGKVRWLSFGGVAGTDTTENTGLRRFKAGWSTERLTSYLCGRVFDRSLYDRLAAVAGASETDYFPAYRAGEF